MSEFVTYIALNDSYAERVESIDVEPGSMGSAWERVIVPVHSGQAGIVKASGAYTATGRVGSKSSLIELRDEGVRIAVIGICLHSRSSEKLWRELLDGSPVELPSWGDAPQPPWCAMRYEVPETVLPDWLDYWAKSVAWSLLIHREAL